MRISEIAQILGLNSKEAIQEVEELRDMLTSQGFKLAKRVTASSGLDDDAVRIVLAEVDKRRREAKNLKAQEETARQQAEQEARRKAEAEKRALEDAERLRQAEEARRKADEALERRRRDLARINAAATPPPGVAPPPPPPVPVRSQPVAPPPVAAAPPPPPAAPAAPQQSAPVQQIPAPPTRVDQRQGAPAAPAAQQQQQQPSAPPARPQQRSQGPGGPASRDRRDSQPRSQGPARTGDSAPPRRDNRGDGKPTRPAAGGVDVKGFLGSGMEPAITDDYTPRRARPEDRGKKKTAPGGDGDRPKRIKPATPRAGIRPTQLFEGAPRRGRPATRPQTARKSKGGRSGGRQQREQKPKRIVLLGDFTVGQFAEKLGVDASEIIRKLFMMGEMLTINQIMNPDLAELIASEYEVGISIERESDDADVMEYLNEEGDDKNLQPRPPVVTIMGHVDHGKTTLLDTIRKANVVETEHGGITQHIGAYFVTTEKGDICFLDTPGHAAFTAMRARGANVTDLVVLVVAANDGVKPQTVEAISHAKAAGVPIVVAINKIDVEGANIDRVKNELMSYELISEDLGGETIMVEISAKQGTNVKALLEMIALQAEVLELAANPDRRAIGTVVESNIDPTRGAVATVLVTQGTLKLSDVFVCGDVWGRVRAMRNDRGEAIESAGPSTPVEILGLSGSPGAGEQFVTIDDEAEAREIADRRQARRKMRAAKASPHVTLDNLSEHLKEGESKELNLIVKADVQGSVEAIVASLNKIKSDKVHLRFLHTGVGAVSESDVHLANASEAIIVGFNVRHDPSTRDLASDLGVEIRTYNIIYELLEEIESAMLGMLAPVYEEVSMARVEVRQVFRITKVGNIAGCFVAEGQVGRTHHARLVRGGTVVWNGKISSLRRHKDEVKEVVSGLECGIGLENYNDIKDGDIIETYVLKERVASLVSTASDSGSSGSGN
ncbi:MAG: translation initiation factor [Candidatus Sumerlaeota bacterium]|nr:translation initiation factor [Candidatus Sumerlaeota bacterium]